MSNCNTIPNYIIGHAYRCTCTCRISIIFRKSNCCEQLQRPKASFHGSNCPQHLVSSSVVVLWSDELLLPVLSQSRAVCQWPEGWRRHLVVLHEDAFQHAEKFSWAAAAWSSWPKASAASAISYLKGSKKPRFFGNKFLGFVFFSRFLKVFKVFFIDFTDCECESLVLGQISGAHDLLVRF